MPKRGPKLVFWICLKACCALLCLYFFICSLELLSTSFRLLSGRHAGDVISRSGLLQNPIVGLMLGILATALIQSSSTTTSIIVGMVAGDLLETRQAIPMVMGANIGTSVTNTIVSTAHMGDRNEFRLAFSAATVQDIFNMLSVLILLPLEIVSGYLFELTDAIVNSMHISKQDHPPDILGPILRPFTSLIVQIDKEVLHDWTLGFNDTKNDYVTTLLRSNCHKSFFKNVTTFDEFNDTIVEEKFVTEYYQCGYLFARSGFSDVWIGLNLLAISLVMLIFCLVMLVKILKSVVKDRLADFFKDSLNSDLPYVPWLTGYVAMLIGGIITFLVQSSSVFTSTLTPIVGSGVLSLERAYELTLGSNIGTTTTGILAALASDSDHLRATLQIALCHLFFNITGIFIFYPIPFMRWPIPVAQILGKTVAKYRWFAMFYMVMVFFILPLYIFGLSMAGPIALYIGVLPFLTCFLLAVVINVLQRKVPHRLPDILRNWDFLPIWMRSLDPIDKYIPTLNLDRQQQSINKVLEARNAYRMEIPR